MSENHRKLVGKDDDVDLKLQIQRERSLGLTKQTEIVVIAPRETTSSSKAEDQSEDTTSDSNNLLVENTQDADGSHNRTQAASAIVANTSPFTLFFGIFLICMVVFRSVMLFLLIKHRHHGNLMLAQPVVLAILLVAGTISIASSFLLVHMKDFDQSVGDAFCFLRDPMIITPLTLAGCILLGRVWRIVLLLTPVLHVKEEDRTCTNVLQRIIMQYLTKLADTYDNAKQFMHGCRYHCVTALVAEMTKQDYSFHTSEGRHQEYAKRKQRATAAKSIRVKIPMHTLLWLIFLLMVPQLILQLCTLIVPAWQERLQVESYTSIQVQHTNALQSEAHPSSWILDTMNAQDATFQLSTVEHWTCNSETGPWPTYVGVILMLIPYVFAAILAWSSQDDLPKVFDEAKATTRSFKVLALVIVVALPPLLWEGATSSQEPDTYVYLTSMLIFAIAMPPCWFVVYPKIWQAFRENAPFKLGHVRRLLRDRSETHTHSVTTAQEDANGKSAKLALTIGKMYEDMGMHSKSLNLFDDALAVWQVDPARHNKEKIGGFTKDEIDSFSVSDLECIIQLLIAKGRVNGTFNSAEKKGQTNAAQAWLDALEVYEVAPARGGMRDRSMFFPVFSGLFIFLKGGKIKDDEKCNFEQNLARKFVRETKLQGDPVHYTRALAMLCEVKGRLGKYKAAMESFELLKKIYDAEEHSADICEAYGTDRSAQAFSQCAMWHMEMGNMELALKQCEYVLDSLMYFMDPTNVLNLNEMLLPILRVYREAGGYEERMRNIYDKYVMQNHDKHFLKHGKTSPCTPVLKPMFMMLEMSCCKEGESIPDFEDAVELLVQEDGAVAPDFVDTLYTKLCWSPHSVTAELCLRLAKQLVAQRGDHIDTETLVAKGINLCQKTAKKVHDSEGGIVLPMACGIHQPLYDELKNLAAQLGIEYVSDLADCHHHASVGNLRINHKNLPQSYRRLRGSSGGGSGSDKSPTLISARGSIISYASGSRSRSSTGTGSKSGSQGSREDDSSNDETLTAAPDGLTKSYVEQRRISMLSRVSDISLDSKLRSKIDSCIESEGLTDPSTELGESINIVSSVEAPPDDEVLTTTHAGDDSVHAGDEAAGPIMF